MAALDNMQSPNEPTDDQKRAARRQALLEETKPFWWAMLGMIGISLLLTLFWQANGAKEGTSWLYITLGLGCLSAGSLIGFLFGIPNTGQAKRDLDSKATADTSTAADRPSTNLEQVSDWLTKIIIGVSLVEWNRITAALGRLGELVQLDIGGSAVAPQVLVVLLGSLGFACGYVWTRLSYGSVQMLLDSNVSQMIAALAQKADAATKEAAKAKVEASQASTKVDTVADTAAANTALLTNTLNPTAKDVPAPAAEPAADQPPQDGPAEGLAGEGMKAQTITATQPDPLTAWRRKLQQFLNAPRDFNDDTTARIFGANLPACLADKSRCLNVKLGPKLAGNIFLFRATVTGTADTPLTGEVILLLHPTYSRPAVSLTADMSSHPAGVTNYEFPASGSFTLIAMADEGRTILSFDLAKLPGLPPGW